MKRKILGILIAVVLFMGVLAFYSVVILIFIPIAIIQQLLEKLRKHYVENTL